MEHFHIKREIDRIRASKGMDAYDDLYSPIAWVADGVRFHGKPCTSLEQMADAIKEGSLDMEGPSDVLCNAMDEMFKTNWINFHKLKEFQPLLSDELFGVVHSENKARFIRWNTGKWPDSYKMPVTHVRLLANKPTTCPLWDKWWDKETAAILEIAEDLP